MNKQSRKILIAEDNPGLARVLSFKFKASGFEPITCADGQLAWDTFQKEDIIAVISDQEMPRMTGLQLCKSIREVDTNIPFFLVTGRQLEINASVDVENYRLTNVFAKPFSPGNVVSAVEAAISEAPVS